MIESQKWRNFLIFLYFTLTINCGESNDYFDENFVTIKAPEEYFNSSLLPFNNVNDEALKKISKKLNKLNIEESVRNISRIASILPIANNLRYFFWNHQEQENLNGDYYNFPDYYNDHHNDNDNEIPENLRGIFEKSKIFLMRYLRNIDPRKGWYAYDMNYYANKPHHTGYGGQSADDAWKKLFNIAKKLPAGNNFITRMLRALQYNISTFITKRYFKNSRQSAYFASPVAFLDSFNVKTSKYTTDAFYDMISQFVVNKIALDRFLENDTNLERFYEVMELDEASKSLINSLVDQYRRLNLTKYDDFLEKSEISEFLKNPDKILRTFDDLIISVKQNVACQSCRIHGLINTIGMRSIFKFLTYGDTACFTPIEYTTALESMAILSNSILHHIDMATQGLYIQVELF